MKHYNPNSEFVRCGTQIKFIGFSMFLFVVVMIISMNISADEMALLMAKMSGTKVSTTVTVNGAQVVQLVDPTPSDDTMNKVIAMSALSSLAVIIFILSLIVTTGKGCYKTSLFGLIFGSVFGVL
jgi:hypothetical protein